MPSIRVLLGFQTCFNMDDERPLPIKLAVFYLVSIISHQTHVLFLVGSPATRYSLNCSKPYEKAVAYELLRSASIRPGSSVRYSLPLGRPSDDPRNHHGAVTIPNNLSAVLAANVGVILACVFLRVPYSEAFLWELSRGGRSSLRHTRHSQPVKMVFELRQE